MTPDLRVARVYVRTLGDPSTRDALLRTLGKASHFLRGEIGRAVGLRVTPVDAILRGGRDEDET
jgi:ribosome-binding factor A